LFLIFISLLLLLFILPHIPAFLSRLLMLQDST
jgi:hypothetical protein